jgi:hypothetical protein
MNKFIWVRDRDKVERYINVDHIIAVTKVPAHGGYNTSAYIVLVKEGEITLSQDDFDTYEDVIAKIQQALA